MSGMTNAARRAHEAIAESLEAIPIDAGGGCSFFKAALMGSLIIDRGLRRIVEIGVHHGRSLIPLAIAAAEVEGARVWGVDPYRSGIYSGEAQEDWGPEIIAWEQGHDWEGTYGAVLGRLAERGLGGHTDLLRMMSRDAVDRFDEIDFLHIDGDHSEEAVTLDIALWLPHVRSGGVVVLDDVSWHGVRYAAFGVERRLELLFRITDLNEMAALGINDFAAYAVP
jgi:predicted O-methyltransferase YrrM